MFANGPLWLCVGLAVLVLTSDLRAGHAQVVCRPNIVGGAACRAPAGAFSSSRPNVFGGVDTTFSDGSRWSCRPNVFGGKDCRWAPRSFLAPPAGDA